MAPEERVKGGGSDAATTSSSSLPPSPPRPRAFSPSPWCAVVQRDVSWRSRLCGASSSSHSPSRMGGGARFRETGVGDRGKGEGRRQEFSPAHSRGEGDVRSIPLALSRRNASYQRDGAVLSGPSPSFSSSSSTTTMPSPTWPFFFPRPSSSFGAESSERLCSASPTMGMEEVNGCRKKGTVGPHGWPSFSRSSLTSAFAATLDAGVLRGRGGGGGMVVDVGPPFSFRGALSSLQERASTTTYRSAFWGVGCRFAATSRSSSSSSTCTTSVGTEGEADDAAGEALASWARRSIAAQRKICASSSNTSRNVHDGRGVPLQHKLARRARWVFCHVFSSSAAIGRLLLLCLLLDGWGVGVSIDAVDLTEGDGEREGGGGGGSAAAAAPPRPHDKDGVAAAHTGGGGAAMSLPATTPSFSPPSDGVRGSRALSCGRWVANGSGRPPWGGSDVSSGPPPRPSSSSLSLASFLP